MRVLVFSSVVCLLSVTAVPAASAQVLGTPTEVTATSVSYHVFARPGEATIQVLVMGDASGGVYVVGTSTNMGELLALAGGTQIGSPQADVIRNVDIRLLREQGGRRAVVYDAPIEQTLMEPSAYPTLQDGDVLVVEARSRRSAWQRARDVLQVTTSFTSLLLLADRIFGIF